MENLHYSGLLLLCFVGSVRSQDCKLADVPVQENFNEKKVISKSKLLKYNYHNLYLMNLVVQQCIKSSEELKNFSSLSLK